jgi:hypothetical protein
METLPDDLWLSVADFLAQDACRNMCLVSKGFRSLMQPKLFRHYVQPGHPDDAPASSRPFIRVCLARPDLAAAVRKATVYIFETWEDDADTSESERPKTTTRDWKCKYSCEIKQLHSKLWPTSIAADDVQRGGILDARYHERLALFNARNLALFCSLVPNIEHLILKLPETPLKVGPVLDYARTHRKLSTPFLSQLRCLQLDFRGGQNGIDLRDLGPLTTLSSLKTLRGCNVYDDEEDRLGPLAMPRQLSIEHINLMRSVLTHGRLKELIEGCHTLKTFQLVYSEIPTGAIFEYDFEVLSSAFLAHKACLQSLTLRFERGTATYLLEDGDIKGVMIMSSFECLRHIDLPAWGMLRGNQDDDDDGNSDTKTISKLLPRSLESLVVRSCDEDTVTALWGLLSSLDTLPYLKEISFTAKHDANLEGLDGFENACKEKRIGLNKVE